MMVLQYRIWDGKKMHYDDSGYSITPDGRIKDFGVDEKNDKLVVLLSTGLKDKNGKEIYEGDIVQFFDTYNKPQKDVIEFAISPNRGFAGFEIPSNVGGTYPLEVIGNIYENPELLK